MEKGNTKEQILKVALDLFSIRGFEATSMAQIADAVGIRKASLYSHYANKQDILDTLVAAGEHDFDERSIFVKANWEDPAFTKDKDGMAVDDVCAMVKGQIRYILHDPKISKIRKMLTIEQFQNEELKVLQTKQSYDVILKYNTGMMSFLMRQGLLKNEDPEIMAAQFAWPISMWTYVCDREPEREEEIMGLIERHIQQFFKVYKK